MKEKQMPRTICFYNGDDSSVYLADKLFSTELQFSRAPGDL